MNNKWVHGISFPILGKLIELDFCQRVDKQVFIMCKASDFLREADNFLDALVSYFLAKNKQKLLFFSCN
ncbi:hypothetical protein SAMN04488514_11052 [Kriegella aquimaris]|uniref:Uncharacterized protein n=1 Tax=Kriegella aquimaris TaxID=192904 RepID=A0A1G9TZN9_9FLAO|nr:hypothetical protein SAMN04488514_11052 [Kriegella aquimaris]